MNLPFPRSYWVEPGRLLAGFYPGDRDPVAIDRKLTALLDCGISRFLNLMEPDELDHSGKPFVQYEARLHELAAQRQRAVECWRFPIVDRSVPTSAEMNAILDTLTGALASGENVYVHCWGGRGRTGTVIGCYLRRARNLSGPEALAILAKLTEHEAKTFWPAPEMPGQRAYIESWRAST